MDWSIKDMDFLIKHWGAYPRRYPAAFPLGIIAALPEKRNWVRHKFTACNFSLVLHGRGEYIGFGRRWLVEAPCVITQWPGEYLEYGPDLPNRTWDEVYLIYDAALYPAFQKQRLVELDRPIWPIRNLPAVQAQLLHLVKLCASPNPTQAVDHVDRACEQLILETLMPSSEPAAESAAVRVIRQIERELASRLHEEIDLDAIPSRYGISPATFRRRWAEVIHMPPARYRLQLRLREACRLLAETDQPIYQIARLVGFADEFYFSRRFHREFSIAPRNYRRMYQVHRETKHA
jgi:AraC-like DNA-binding protein